MRGREGGRGREGEAGRGRVGKGGREREGESEGGSDREGGREGGGVRNRSTGPRLSSSSISPGRCGSLAAILRAPSGPMLQFLPSVKSRA
jgi:hypothetical protein